MSDAGMENSTEMIRRALDDFGLQSATVECLPSTDHINARITADCRSYFLKILASDCTGRQYGRAGNDSFLADLERQPEGQGVVGGDRTMARTASQSHLGRTGVAVSRRA